MQIKIRVNLPALRSPYGAEDGCTLWQTIKNIIAQRYHNSKLNTYLCHLWQGKHRYRQNSKLNPPAFLVEIAEVSPQDALRRRQNTEDGEWRIS